MNVLRGAGDPALMHYENGGAACHWRRCCSAKELELLAVREGA